MYVQRFLHSLALCGHRADVVHSEIGVDECRRALVTLRPLVARPGVMWHAQVLPTHCITIKDRWLHCCPVLSIVICNATLGSHERISFLHVNVQCVHNTSLIALPLAMAFCFGVLSVFACVLMTKSMFVALATHWCIAVSQTSNGSRRGDLHPLLSDLIRSLDALFYAASLAIFFGDVYKWCVQKWPRWRFLEGACYMHVAVCCSCHCVRLYFTRIRHVFPALACCNQIHHIAAAITGSIESIDLN